MQRTEATIRGVIFDKDGTLVSFHHTWDVAVDVALREVCPDTATRVALAEAVGYDLPNRRVLDDSPFVAESAATLDLLVAPFADPRAFEDAVVRAGAVHVAPEPGAVELVESLRAAGMPLAIATNDSAESAVKQFTELGMAHHFVSMLGYDSGFGAKPDPGMVVAAADAIGCAVGETAMVGDSSTDVYSGLAAGAVTVYFARGETDPELANAADLVITNISVLPAALGIPINPTT